MARVKRHRILMWAALGVVLAAGIGVVVASNRVPLTTKSDEREVTTEPGGEGRPSQGAPITG